MCLAVASRRCDTMACILDAASGVPRTTPQSITMWKGLPSARGKVIRKQSPSPWRYMRTVARGPACVDFFLLEAGAVFLAAGALFFLVVAIALSSLDATVRHGERFVGIGIEI